MTAARWPVTLRSNREDVDAAVRALRGVRHGRITLIVPTSDRLARALLHQSRSAAVEYVRDVVRYARDQAPDLPVDMALMDAPHAEPEALAEIAELMTEEGVAVVKICDSMGELFPATIARLVCTVSERVGPHVVLGAHFHNDYGLALANNLQAIQGGIRVVASSWLGLGERNGLAPTEQLLFALGYQADTLEQRLPGVRDLWWTVPSTLGIVPLARQISEWAEVPLKSTDAVVGTGMNVRATGTAFIAPQFFRPFDPEQVLGVGPQVVLTQLASARIVTAVALELGYTLSPEQARAAVQWVKHRAFSRSTSVVPREEFEIFLAGMQVHRAAG